MSVEHPSLREAAPTPYWLDRADRPAPRGALEAHTTTDLCIVGGGYSGLWTAILAKERDPSRDVVLLEGQRVGWAASGRNGGFCAASLTHGRANGAERFPDEIDRLDELGRENLDSIAATLTRYGIACDFERPGTIAVATEPHQVEWLSRADVARTEDCRSPSAPKISPISPQDHYDAPLLWRVRRCSTRRIRCWCCHQTHFLTSRRRFIASDSWSRGWSTGP